MSVDLNAFNRQVSSKNRLNAFNEEMGRKRLESVERAGNQEEARRQVAPPQRIETPQEPSKQLMGGNNFAGRPLAAYNYLKENRPRDLFPRIMSGKAKGIPAFVARAVATPLDEFIKGITALNESLTNPLVGVAPALSRFSPTFKKETFDPWLEKYNKSDWQFHEPANSMGLPSAPTYATGAANIIPSIAKPLVGGLGLMGRSIGQMVRANNPVGQELAKSTGSTNLLKQFGKVFKEGTTARYDLPEGVKTAGEVFTDITNFAPLLSVGARAAAGKAMDLKTMGGFLGSEGGFREGLTLAKATKPTEEMNWLLRAWSGAPKGAGVHTAEELGMKPLKSGLPAWFGNLPKLNADSRAIESTRDAIDVLGVAASMNKKPEELVGFMKGIINPDLLGQTKLGKTKIGKTLAGQRAHIMMQTAAQLPDNEFKLYSAAKPIWEEIKRGIGAVDEASLAKFIEANRNDVTKWPTPELFKAFQKVKDIPFNDEHFGANLVLKMGGAMSEEGAKLYGVKTPSSLAQMRNISKNVSNALFLSDSPMYVYSNTMNDVVMFPATGLTGWLNDPETAFKRFGWKPAIAEQALAVHGGKTKGVGKVIEAGMQKGTAKNPKTSGFLSKAERLTSKLTERPGNLRISRAAESVEGIARKAATSAGLSRAMHWLLQESMPAISDDLARVIGPDGIKALKNAWNTSWSMDEFVDKIMKPGKIRLSIDGLSQGDAEFIQGAQTIIDKYIDEAGDIARGIEKFRTDAALKTSETHANLFRDIIKRDEMVLNDAKYGKEAGFSGVWGLLHDIDRGFRNFFDDADKLKDELFQAGLYDAWPALDARLTSNYSSLIFDDVVKRDALIVDHLIKNGVDPEVAKLTVPNRKMLLDANHAVRRGGSMAKEVATEPAEDLLFNVKTWDDYNKLYYGEIGRANTTLAEAMYGKSPAAAELAKQINAITQKAAAADWQAKLDLVNTIKKLMKDKVPDLNQQRTIAYTKFNKFRSDLWEQALRDKTRALGGFVNSGTAFTPPARSAQDAFSELARLRKDPDGIVTRSVLGKRLKNPNFDMNDPKTIAKIEKMIGEVNKPNKKVLAQLGESGVLPSEASIANSSVAPKNAASLMGQVTPQADDLYTRAESLVRGMKEVGASDLQRELGVGASDINRVMKRLENNGIVGPAEADGKRAVFYGPAAAPPTRPITMDFTLPTIDRASIERNNMETLNRVLEQAMVQGQYKFNGLQPDQMNLLLDWIKNEASPAMFDIKIGATKLAEFWGNQALLDYTRRHGFNDVLSYVYPYEFWYTTSMANWARKFISKPNYLQYIVQAQRAIRAVNDDPGYPSRLKGKTNLGHWLPFLPDWAGDVSVDLMKLVGLPFSAWLVPLQNIEYGSQREQAQKNLDEAIAKGENPEKIDELQKALDIAPNEEVGDSLAIMSSMSPVFSAGMALLGGSPVDKLWSGGRLIRQVSTALGHPIDIEGAVRSKMPDWMQQVFPVKGQFDTYRVERMVRNMANDGTLTPEEAERALNEHNGRAWDLAVQRAGQEELSGAYQMSLYPAGEKNSRALSGGLGALYEAAKKNAGDVPFAQYKPEDQAAISKWYDDHPEYRINQQLFQLPGERWKGSASQKIWDLPELTRSQLWKQYPEEMERLRTKQQSYEDVARLAEAAGIKLFDIPQPVSGEKPVPFVGQPPHEKAQPLTGATPEQSTLYDEFKKYMAKKYGEDMGTRIYDRTRFGLPPDATMKKYQLEQGSFYGKHPEIARLVNEPDSRLTPNQQEAVYEFDKVVSQLPGDLWKSRDEYYRTRDMLGDIAADAVLKKHPEIEMYWELKDKFELMRPDIVQAKRSLDTYDAYQEAYDKHIQEAKLKFGRDIYDKQSEYYKIPEANKAKRDAYVVSHPELKAYWTWQRAWKAENPAVVNRNK